MQQYYKQGELEIGLDEAGRGCLFGPVCVAGVIWVNEDPNPDLQIKDSKKMSEKKRKILREYIESNAIAYNIQFICSEEIDKINILEASILGMNQCIDEIVKTTKIDTILIDGPHFNFYDGIPHVCINGGDNKYKSIDITRVTINHEEQDSEDSKRESRSELKS